MNKSREKNVLAAAALQQHMTQFGGVGGLVLESQKCHKYPLSLRQRQLAKWKKNAQLQRGAKLEDDDVDRVQEKRPNQSLAQKLGLIPGPELPLSLEDWKTVKEKCSARGDFLFPCPICQEGFHQKQQVILSCSHVFHQDCIESYERFIQQRVCPVCRSAYQGKLLTTEGTKQVRKKAATRIQAAWKGYLARKTFWRLQEKYPPKDPRLLFKFNMKKIEKKRSRLEKNVSRTTSTVKNLIDKLDVEMEISRKMMAKLSQSTSKQEDTNSSSDTIPWESIYQKSVERGYDSCSICLNALQSNTKRSLALLNCTHLFHASCIESFERYGHHQSCPICRLKYQKLVLSV